MAALSPPVQTIGTRFIPVSWYSRSCTKVQRGILTLSGLFHWKGIIDARWIIKIAAATPDLHAADCAYNTSEIVKLAKAAAKGAKLITFPELCLTGYTCGDLFLPAGNAARGRDGGARYRLPRNRGIAAVIVVGLPLRYNGKLYNIAAPKRMVSVGICAQDPSSNYSEFYEQRHFILVRHDDSVSRRKTWR